MIINKDNIEIRHFYKARIYPNQYKYNNKIPEEKFMHLVKARELSEELARGDVCEFGVHIGTSLGYLCKFREEEVVFGFDSFDGLPEDWNTGTHLRSDGIIKKEEFKIKQNFEELLKTFPKNAIIVKGWFEEAIPRYLKNFKPSQLKFLHIDSDLYSSAKTILTLLNDYIVPGTVIVFDELYPFAKPMKYPNWAEGEWKALVEWVEEYDREFEIPFRSGYWNATIRITK